MALFDRFKKKATAIINVTFINHANGSIIARCDLPPEQLPETFAINTVMHLGDQDWEVLKAEPSEKYYFLQTGELTLVMQRVGMINPSEILFSLPTIANELPALSETTFSAKFCHVMDEDDWRQCEFFDVHQRERILMELEKVADLKNYHQQSTHVTIPTFDKIHVRDLSDVPELSISLLAFLHQLQVSDVGAIKFENTSGYIAQGFVVETAFHLYYGLVDVEEEGILTLENLKIRMLAVQPKSDDLSEIVQLLQAFNLIYVDWCETTSMDRLN